MNVKIVTNELEMAEVNRVMDGHAALLSDKITRKEWEDTVVYPRETWLYIDKDEYKMPFVVVDNREGECFVEQFESLDGAIFYACDVYLTGEHQESWDYPGAVKDRGNLKREEPFPCI